jgi:hypothetical protein
VRRQHFDELEADFQQYYNLDITAVRPARAARLMFQLPTRSRLFRKLEPANNWDWPEVLQNKIAYMLEVIAWQNANQGVKKSKQTKPPTYYQPDFMKKASQAKRLNPEQVVGTTAEIKDILSRPRK